MRVRLTGASGFLGQNLLASSRLSRIERASLRGDAWRSEDLDGVDAVVCLTGIAHQNAADESLYFEVNRDLVIAFAERAKQAGVGQFVFVSSSKVYGGSTGPAEEFATNSECRPTDAYGRSKLEAEAGLRALESADFVVTLLRIPVVYGPGVKANFAALGRLMATGLPLPLDYRKNRRSVLYVRNFVDFVDHVVETRQGGTFNLADATAPSLGAICRALPGPKLGKSLLFPPPAALVRLLWRLRPGIAERLFGSFVLEVESTFEKTGFRPRFNTEEGLRLSFGDAKG